MMEDEEEEFVMVNFTPAVLQMPTLLPISNNKSGGNFIINALVNNGNIGDLARVTATGKDREVEEEGEGGEGEEGEDSNGNKGKKKENVSSLASISGMKSLAEFTFQMSVAARCKRDLRKQMDLFKVAKSEIIAAIAETIANETGNEENEEGIEAKLAELERKLKELVAKHKKECAAFLAFLVETERNAHATLANFLQHQQWMCQFYQAYSEDLSKKIVESQELFPQLLQLCEKVSRSEELSMKMKTKRVTGSGIQTDLHQFVYMKNVERVKEALNSYVIANGSSVPKYDINAVNDFGDTPLHIAVERGSFTLVQLLLSYSPEIIENDSGRTPLDFLREKKDKTSKDKRIMELITQYLFTRTRNSVGRGDTSTSASASTSSVISNNINSKSLIHNNNNNNNNNNNIGSHKSMSLSVIATATNIPELYNDITSFYSKWVFFNLNELAQAENRFNEIKKEDSKQRTLLKESSNMTKKEALAKLIPLFRSFIYRRRFRLLVRKLRHSPEGKKLQARMAVFKELLNSEKSFGRVLNNLRKICDNVIEVKDIFFDFLALNEFHNQAMKLLDEMQKSYPTFSIGSFYTKLAPLITPVFVTYMNSYSSAIERIHNLRGTNSHFKSKLEETESLTEHKSLYHYLPIPLRRVTRFYQNLLQAKAETDVDHVDYPFLIAAVETFEKYVMVDISEPLRKAEISHAAVILLNMSQPQLLLKSPTRSLVLNGVVTIKDAEPWDCHLVLFNDVIFFASIHEKGVTCLRGHFPILGCSVEDVAQTQDLTFLKMTNNFQIRFSPPSVNNSFPIQFKVIVSCQLKALKDDWMSNIKSTVQDIQKKKDDAREKLFLWKEVQSPLDWQRDETSKSGFSILKLWGSRNSDRFRPFSAIRQSAVQSLSMLHSSVSGGGSGGGATKSDRDDAGQFVRAGHLYKLRSNKKNVKIQYYSLYSNVLFCFKSKPLDSDQFWHPGVGNHKALMLNGATIQIKSSDAASFTNPKYQSNSNNNNNNYSYNNNSNSSSSNRKKNHVANDEEDHHDTISLYLFEIKNYEMTFVLGCERASDRNDWIAAITKCLNS